MFACSENLTDVLTGEKEGEGMNQELVGGPTNPSVSRFSGTIVVEYLPNYGDSI